MKYKKTLSSLFLKGVGIYLGSGPFSSDVGIVNVHPSKGTHWVSYINENSFVSYACVCPKRRSRFTIKRNGCCLYPEYKTVRKIKKDSFCASYCLYIIYLTKS